LHLSDKEKAIPPTGLQRRNVQADRFTMNVSERTVDGYRENLFRKLDVQSRTGMALEAIRRN
jgi:FixJ family two-component response regulator